MRALLCLILLGGVAAAGGRKVVVESDPPGATVYLNDKEAGPVCPATPCTIDVPANGDANIIIEASGYAPEFASVDLAKKGKLSVKVSLKKAMGTIVVDSPKGAMISVDDTDEGKAPQRVEVEAGGHHVVLTQNGKAVFDDFVDVDVNGEVPIEPKSKGVDPNETENVLEEKPTEPAKKAHAPWIYGALAVDVGFRKFTYSGTQPGMTAKLREEDESGEVLAGPMLEIYPMAIAGLDVAKGLAIVFRYQYGLNAQKVSATGFTGDVTTFWQSLEISAKYRWIFFDQLAVEAGAGYARDTYRFNGMQDDILLVPDADYSALRIGVRAAYLSEVAGTKLEPYLLLEPRLVTDGGNLKSRFMSGSVSGFHGAVGVLAHFGSITAKLEGALSSYSWSLSPKTATDFQATGASDSIKYIAFGVGYTY